MLLDDTLIRRRHHICPHRRQDDSLESLADAEVADQVMSGEFLP